MVTTAKAQVISDWYIAIPEDWVNSLGLDDGASVDLSMSDDKITTEKARHLLEDMCSLLDDIEFTDSDHTQVKKSLFPFENAGDGNLTAGHGCCEDNLVVNWFEI
jgi:antitoxin component of MazEF toxin-antitoxin module